MNIRYVTVTAKKRYCEIKKPGWLGIVYKIQAKEPLTDNEYKKYQQLEREMLNIVNGKADLISGLTKNNPNKARFCFSSCIFIVKYTRNVGKIITVQQEK